MRTAIACLIPIGIAVAMAAQPGKAPPMPEKAPQQQPRTVLVIHGGAGVMSEAEMKAAGLTRQDYEKVLAQALTAGYESLKVKGHTSTHAVEAAIRVLEDSELYNAGRGGVFNSDGRVELDASIMEGKMEGSGEGKRDPRKRAGAIAGVSHIKNPISAARAVMEMEGSQNVLLIGEGAELYTLSESVRTKYDLERVSNIYFWTDRRLKQIRDAHDKAPMKRGDALRPELKFGTVGAVALDANNNLTAGTSTGGLSNKRAGRVGDSPIIGAGTYADDRACGVSCTGTGEVFIRHAVAHDIVARMLYGKSNVADAVRDTMNSIPDEPGGVGGLIALDATGHHAFGMSKQCEGMYRGYVTEKGEVFVGIYAGDEMKEVK
jgi:beta-aspartyl-peptidase (threonine type)